MLQEVLFGILTQLCISADIALRPVILKTDNEQLQRVISYWQVMYYKALLALTINVVTIDLLVLY